MRSILILAACAVLAGCAETTAPLPPPQVSLLVVDSVEGTLRIIPIAAPDQSLLVSFGAALGPSGVAARDSLALVPLRGADAAWVIDLRNGDVIRSIPLPKGSGATGAELVDDATGYVANPELNSVTRVNLLTGDTLSRQVGRYPQGVAVIRGRVFVLNGNTVPCFQPTLPGQRCSLGPSWLTVLDPALNQLQPLTSGPDSIPLPGPGNARESLVGPDGMLYVMNRGNIAFGEGRLSIVDPVEQEEVANFGGFATYPNSMAMGADSLFVASPKQGLLIFDLRARSVARADVPALPGGLSEVAVAPDGRVFAIDVPTCHAGDVTAVHVLRPDLSEIGTIPVGPCPIAAKVVAVPVATP
ncbi:MAG TPA: hypothetical protein VFL95_06045 [Gemmatimonadales bacterium]|nr:hypothetical protein [Gemmatimonadales bacterium]